MHEGRFFAEGAVPPPYGAVEQHQLFQPAQPQPALAAAERGSAGGGAEADRQLTLTLTLTLTS